MTLHKDDRIWFHGKVRPYRVRIANERYAVCTKPFNPQRTVLYTVVDLQKQWRGPENLIFGMGAETDQQCRRMLRRITKGASAVSRRHGIPLMIERVKSVTTETQP